VVVALALAVLLLPAVIAPSIAREREQGNFDLLRGTALSMREILQAKYMAGLFGCFGLAAAIGWTMLLAPLLPTRPFSSAVTTPWIWLAAAVVLPLTGLFTAAVSIFAAVAARRTVAALVGAYGALLALFVVVPVLCALAGRPGGMPDYFWGINPFIGFTVAVDDKDGLACLFLFGVLYAAGTAGVWFAALRLFQQRHARDV
jgi:ABC-type transport system involved in multi-copper enzyme maturation permease subunit